MIVRAQMFFVLATANNIYCLPNSLMRAGRFDKVIQMTCPGGDDAKKIIKHFLSKKTSTWRYRYR